MPNDANSIDATRRDLEYGAAALLGAFLSLGLMATFPQLGWLWAMGFVACALVVLFALFAGAM